MRKPQDSHFQGPSAGSSQGDWHPPRGHSQAVELALALSETRIEALPKVHFSEEAEERSCAICLEEYRDAWLGVCWKVRWVVVVFFFKFSGCLTFLAGLDGSVRVGRKA